MKYTVIWMSKTENQLAEIWLNAHNPSAVQRASHELDEILKRDPLTRSTMVDNLQYLRIDPLVVLFDVSEEDRLVRVVDVHAVVTN